MWDAISAVSELPEQTDLNQRVYLSLKPAASDSQTSPSQGQFMWSAENKEKVYMAAGGAGVLAGHTGKFHRDSDGYARISSPEHAVITATPLDGAPWPQSNKILITACGRCENSGMEFSRDRRTVGRRWGAAPVRVETVKGTVMIPVGRWRCQALKPDGAVSEDVPVRLVGEANYVDLSPRHATMWYLLTRI
jgi:hypothetical protein